MTLTNYQIAIIAGGFTMIGALVGSFITHRLTMSRDRRRAISEINKTLLDEIKSIEIEMNAVRTINSPLEWLSAVRRFDLGSVNFTAFKKTCTQKQQKELDAAYNNYKTTDEKYQSLTHLKNLVEEIINNR